MTAIIMISFFFPFNKTTKCQCYGETQILVQSTCDSTTCPANANERCAVGDAGVIYEKGNLYNGV